VDGETRIRHPNLKEPILFCRYLIYIENSSRERTKWLTKISHKFDEFGDLLFQSVRFEPKSFRQRHLENGDWIWGLNGQRRVVYRLHDIYDATTVYIVEGEKDAETLWSRGFPATCNPMGAGKWRSEYNETFRHKSVVILQDADEPGRKHSEHIAAELYPVANGIKLVAPLPIGKDITEFFQNGGTEEQFIQIIESTPNRNADAPVRIAAKQRDNDWNARLPAGTAAKQRENRNADAPVRILAEQRENAPNQPATDPFQPLRVLKASEVIPREVEFLWYPYIPKRKVTLFSGPEGSGKSWTFCAIAAGLTNGYLPLTESFEPKSVLIFSTEDNADDAIVPRLIKCGADLERVSIINERFTFDQKGMLRFEYCIADHRPDWVMLDPLFAYSDLRLDLNRPHHARHVANSIEQIAERHDTAISYLIHFNKSKGQGDARAAVTASQEFSNAARSIILVGTDPKDERRRALVHRKSSYAPKGKSIGYEITGDRKNAQFFWTGESPLTERDLVDRAGSSEEHAEKLEAVEFLEIALKDGPREAKQLSKEASAIGISEHQLRTARNKIGIKPYCTGNGTDKKWFWSIPASPQAIDK
jgi:hypothetical protein